MQFGSELFEIQILKHIHDSLSCDFLDIFMPFISALGNEGLIWIILALYLLIRKKHRQTGAVVALSLILCLLLGNLILKPLIARPRPFAIDEGIALLISAPNDFSFPSGHTLSSFAAAFSLLFMRREGLHSLWWVSALILATLIAISRLYLSVHYPSDVATGVILGFGIAYLSRFIVRFKK